MAILSSLVVQLGLDSAEFKKGLYRAKKGIKGFSKDALSLSSTISKIGLGGATTAAAGLGYALISTSNSLAQLNREAKNLALDPSTLDAIGFAAHVTGLEVDTVADAMKDLAIKITDATTGAGPMVDFFKEINQSAEDWAELSPDQQLKKFNEQLQKMPVDRARFFADEVNDSMYQLSGTLRENGGEFFRLADQAKKTGLALDIEMFQKASQANKEFKILTGTLGALKNHLTVALSPAMAAISSALTQWITDIAASEGGFAAFAGSMAKNILKGVSVSLEALFKFGQQAKTIWQGVVDFFGLDPVAEAKANIERVTDQLKTLEEQVAGGDFSQGTFFGKFLGSEEMAREKIELLKADLETYKAVLENQPNFDDGLFNTEWIDALIAKYEELDEKTQQSGEIAVEVAEQVKETAQAITAEMDQSFGEFTANLDNTKKGCSAAGVGMEMSFGGIGGSLEGLGSTMAAFSIGSEETQKKMFIASKAFALAQALMDSKGAILQAWNSAPFPYNLPSIAMTTGAVLAQVAGIQGITLGSGKATGGGVGRRTMYPVNEQGLEMFSANGADYLLTGNQGGHITPARQIGAASSTTAPANMPISVNISMGAASDERSLVRAMGRASKALQKAVYSASKAGARNKGVVYA